MDSKRYYNHGIVIELRKYNEHSNLLTLHTGESYLEQES